MARFLSPSTSWVKWGGRYAYLLLLGVGIGCAASRRYYLHSELPKLEKDDALTIAPGPWPEVPAVVSEVASVPDDLVLPALHALMALPGAMGACDANSQRPRADASEYCLAIYRTPEDWRVSWPIRNTQRSMDACVPPFGGVTDADFQGELPVFGYAHNHPCGTGISGQDLSVWPFAKVGDGAWTMVAYGTTSSGKLARDSNGQLIPAWGWLVTGYPSAPR
ncbi:hypothetical protein [Myxococcus eversor]|uniref:hypothetical protein n=1 Tax=Myxococcus eversor TaxID=2709661 RepID=UPI001F07C4D9|nr:hypothetical protein [Myxococcus eversor]